MFNQGQLLLILSAFNYKLTRKEKAKGAYYLTLTTTTQKKNLEAERKRIRKKKITPIKKRVYNVIYCKTNALLLRIHVLFGANTLRVVGRAGPLKTMSIYQCEWIALKTRFDSQLKFWISFAIYRRAT